MKNILQIIAFAAASLLITGCRQPLTDDRILELANGYALAKGLNLSNYEVSVSEIDFQSKESFSHVAAQNKRLSKTAKVITDCRTVVFSPKDKRLGPAYTFYISQKDGKLAGVSRRK